MRTPANAGQNAPVIRTGAFWWPVITSLVVGAAFVAVSLSLNAAPRPQGLPVAAVGPQSAAALAAAAAPGAFDIRIVTSQQEGIELVRGGEAVATVAGVPGGEVAQAGSADAASRGALASAAKPARTVDVLPANSGDTNGIPLANLTFGVVLTSFLFAVASVARSAGLRRGGHRASAAVFAIGIATIGTVIATLTGAVERSQFAVFALLAVGSFAVSATCAVLLRANPLWGGTLATLTMVVLGAATGGVLPAWFLPGPFALARATMPAGLIMTGVRDQQYYGGESLLAHLAALSAWAGVALVLVTVLSRRHASRRS